MMIAAAAPDEAHAEYVGFSEGVANHGLEGDSGDTEGRPDAEPGDDAGHAVLPDNRVGNGVPGHVNGNATMVGQYSHDLIDGYRRGAKGN